MSTFFEGTTPLVVAHRGFADGVPENTLEAFEKAVTMGVDILETDVHGSRDAEAIIAHDPDLTRVASLPHTISALSLKDIQKVDLGGARMPTLAQALNEFPHHRFSIDIKDDLAIEPTVKAIKAARAEDRVMLASFSPSRLHAVSSQLPGSVVAGTAMQVGPAWLSHLISLKTGVSRALVGIDALFIPPRAYGLPLLTSRFIEMVNDAGVSLGAWTINDEAEMARYWSSGVRAIVTDRSDVALAVRARLASPTP